MKFIALIDLGNFVKIQVKIIVLLPVFMPLIGMEEHNSKKRQADLDVVVSAKKRESEQKAVQLSHAHKLLALVDESFRQKISDYLQEINKPLELFSDEEKQVLIEGIAKSEEKVIYWKKWYVQYFFQNYLCV